MTDPTNHVLQAIDNAVQDFELSADAMRWAPDGAATIAPSKALRRPIEQRQHSPRFSEPMRWEQRKTTCTLAEIEAWLTAENELARHGPVSAVVDALPPTSIMMHRQHPPCVGCGRPTGTHLGNALTIEGMNEPVMTATFQPCGCRLAVAVPAILDHVPPATRPTRYVGHVIPGELLHERADDRAVEYTKARIVQSAEERPHVVLVLDDGDPRLEQFDSIRGRMMPGDKAVVAFWLHAEPGGTEYIVYRAAPDMPVSDMPTDLEGRWERRASIPGALVSDRRFPLLSTESFNTATARPTGRVEISPEGSVAEVYEIRPDYLPG